MINRNCILCHYDTTPYSEPPYCKLFYEDYDCEHCKLTEEQKEEYYNGCEKAQKWYDKQILNSRICSVKKYVYVKQHMRELEEEEGE